MSRVAKNPVAIPAKVEIVLNPDSINVSGPLGKLMHPLTGAVTLTREGETITFAAANDSQHSQIGRASCRERV